MFEASGLVLFCSWDQKERDHIQLVVPHELKKLSLSIIRGNLSNDEAQRMTEGIQQLKGNGQP
jgi:hypothetical protein